MKHYILIVLLLLLVGCGRERIADISTPAVMADKDILLIFPSIPEEFCYADRMSEILNSFSGDVNGTDAQVLSTLEHVNCSSYGFVECSANELEIEGKTAVMISCLSDDSQKVCFYIIGDEYRDVEGETFDESCILGVNRS